MYRPDHEIFDSKRCPACGSEPKPEVTKGGPLDPVFVREGSHRPIATTIDTSTLKEPGVVFQLNFECTRCNAHWPAERS